MLSNFPLESGPKTMESETFNRPAFMIPSTTVPTYGTDLMNRHDRGYSVLGTDDLPNFRDAVLEELGVKPITPQYFAPLTSNGWSAENFSVSPSLEGSKFKKARS